MDEMQQRSVYFSTFFLSFDCDRETKFGNTFFVSDDQKRTDDENGMFFS